MRPFKTLALAFLSCAALALSGGGCGAGGAGAGSASLDDPPAPTPAPPSPVLALAPCAPSGLGVDYQVGDGKLYTALDQVPWESLGPGDTVRIFYRATPYFGKFLVAAQGTAAAPVRICGVRGLNGERPIIDGQGATTRPALLTAYGNTTETRDIHQARSLIVIKPLATQAWEAYPRHIQIDGLTIRRGHPLYSFTDAAGASKPYDEFGACIWVDRGHDITIADNEISDCSMAVFSTSKDYGDFALTKNLRLTGNYFWGHGIVGDVHEHATYTQSVGTVIEFNRYGPMRPGSDGNPIKDRSVGTVVRFNRIEGGAHSIDLVEAEDYPIAALSNPAYRTTFVYGNQIVKDGDTGSFIHYGGDHFGGTPGGEWGEPIFRKGTLYFFNNTVHVTGTSAELFQIDTTEERAEIWNNVFVFAPSVAQGWRSMRAQRLVGAPWTAGGIVNLGRNWISEGWADSDEYHPVGGQLNGAQNLIVGAAPPIDLATMLPLPGSAVVDAGQAGPSAASAFAVSHQLTPTYSPMARSVNGGGIDLGAVER
jgi:hypothetical protein